MLLPTDWRLHGPLWHRALLVQRCLPARRCSAGLTPLPSGRVANCISYTKRIENCFVQLWPIRSLLSVKKRKKAARDRTPVPKKKKQPGTGPQYQKKRKRGEPKKKNSMLLLLAFDPRVFVRGPMQVSQWKLAWRFRPRADWLATLDYCCLMVWSTCEFVVQMIWAYRLMDPCTYFHARCHGWCFLVGVGFSLSVLCLFLIGQLASHFILSGPIPWRLRSPCRARAPAEEKKCQLVLFSVD